MLLLFILCLSLTVQSGYVGITYHVSSASLCNRSAPIGVVYVAKDDAGCRFRDNWTRMYTQVTTAVGDGSTVLVDFFDRCRSPMANQTSLNATEQVQGKCVIQYQTITSAFLYIYHGATVEEVFQRMALPQITPMTGVWVNKLSANCSGDQVQMLYFPSPSTNFTGNGQCRPFYANESSLWTSLEQSLGSSYATMLTSGSGDEVRVLLAVMITILLLLL